MNENLKQKHNTQNINYTFTSAFVQNDNPICTTTMGTDNKNSDGTTINKPNLKRTLPIDVESFEQIQKLPKMDNQESIEIGTAKSIQKPSLCDIKAGDKDSIDRDIKMSQLKEDNHAIPIEADVSHHLQRPNISANPFRNPIALPLLQDELQSIEDQSSQKKKRKKNKGKRRKKRKYYFMNAEQQNISNNSELEKRMSSVEDDILNEVKIENPDFDIYQPISNELNNESKYVELQTQQRKGIHSKSLKDDVEWKNLINNEILTQQQHKITEIGTDQPENKQSCQNQRVNLKRKRLSGAQRKRLKKLRSMDTVKLQENSSNILPLQKSIEYFKDADIKSSLTDTKCSSNALKNQEIEQAQNQNLQRVSQKLLSDIKPSTIFQSSDITFKDMNKIPLQPQSNLSNLPPFDPIKSDFISVMKKSLNSTNLFKDSNVENNPFIKEEPNIEPYDDYTHSLISPINLKAIKTESNFETTTSQKSKYQISAIEMRENLQESEAFSRTQQIKSPVPSSFTSKDIQLCQQQEKSDLPTNKITEICVNTNQESNITKSTSRKLTKRRIKVSIISESSLDHDQLDKLEDSILDQISKTPSGVFSPTFYGSSKQAGFLTIICANSETRSWLAEVVANIEPWPGAKFKLINGQKVRDKAHFWIPNDLKSNSDEILRRLDIQNPGLSTNNWTVINRVVKETGQILVVEIDKDSRKVLAKMNNKPFLNLSKVFIKFKK